MFQTITDKASLLAVWGTGVVGTALYLFVVDRGVPLPPELGMAFGAVVGFVTGRELGRREPQ